MQLKSCRLGRQDVTHQLVLLEVVMRLKVEDRDVVEIVVAERGVGGGRQQHRDLRHVVGAEVGRLTVEDLVVALPCGRFVHDCVCEGAAKGTLPAEFGSRVTQGRVLAENKHVQRGGGVLGGGTAQAAGRGGGYADGRRRRRRRGISGGGGGGGGVGVVVGGAFGECELAQVVKVGLEVVHGSEDEHHAESGLRARRVHRLREVLPRHRRLLLALAQVRLHRQVLHRARSTVPREHCRLDDGAAEGLVRVREHREQLGLAAVQLLRDGGHQGELLAHAERRVCERPQIRHHFLLGVLGDVVVEARRDLLGLAVHARMLDGLETRELLQEREDRRIHVRKRAQKVERVQDERHLPFELVVREHAREDRVHVVLVRLVQMVHTKQLRPIVRVDALNQQEMLDEGCNARGREVEHPALVLVAEGVDRLGGGAEGGDGGGVRKRCFMRAEGVEDERAEAVVLVHVALRVQLLEGGARRLRQL
mmetsp:Transcript_29806/g.65172  ORF Transcript_29806/g.65172 Transcript_29806/m.65172 type:complete len:478 (+) Transcript_29806:663-2096(+)